mgnify:CR=1 FL=1
MAGRIGYEEILGALAQRYDFHSAHAILVEALNRVGLDAQQEYTPEEASRIVWGLNLVGQRAQPAVMALLELVGEAATADLPEEEEEEQVEEADMPMIIAQVVQAAVATARAKAQARAEARESRRPAPTEGEERGQGNGGEGGTGPGDPKRWN